MVLAVVAAQFAGSHAFAAPSTSNNPANTLKITPVRSDIEVKPGQSKTVEMTVTNLTGAPITVHPGENDFIAGDEKGSPALILDETQYAPTHSLKRFMTPLKDVTVPANKSVTINVLITVPASAQAGGYFGAVRFAPANPSGGGQVNLNASVASLILLTVPGNTVEKLDLTDFAVQQHGQTGNFFNTNDSIQTTIRFQSDSNVQVAPFGKISVTQGKKVVYETDFNNSDPKDMILPDSSRRWDVPLRQLGTFGHYTVTATITYGKNNQTMQISKSFWIVPQAVIIAAIIGLIILLALIIWTIFRLRKKAQRRNQPVATSEAASAPVTPIEPVAPAAQMTPPVAPTAPEAQPPVQPAASVNEPYRAPQQDMPEQTPPSAPRE